VRPVTNVRDAEACAWWPMGIATLLVLSAIGLPRPGQIVPLTSGPSFQGRGAASRTAAAALTCAAPGRDVRLRNGTRALAVHVRIYNEAPVEPDVLSTALKRVESVFDRAGVALQWTFTELLATGTSPRFDLVLVRTAPQLRSSTAPLDGLLGHANPAGYRAHAYVEAIRSAAAAFHTAIAHLLGDVIAHELGHLLLPAHGHSDWGIMRPDVLRRGLPRWFLPREAATMAQRITADAVGRRHPKQDGEDSSVVRTFTRGASPRVAACRAATIAEWRCPEVEGPRFAADRGRGPDACR
jgi:hypothetical protein